MWLNMTLPESKMLFSFKAHKSSLPNASDGCSLLMFVIIVENIKNYKKTERNSTDSNNSNKKKEK